LRAIAVRDERERLTVGEIARRPGDDWQAQMTEAMATVRVAPSCVGASRHAPPGAARHPAPPPSPKSGGLAAMATLRMASAVAREGAKRL